MLVRETGRRPLMACPNLNFLFQVERLGMLAPAADSPLRAKRAPNLAADRTVFAHDSFGSVRLALPESILYLESWIVKKYNVEQLRGRRYRQTDL